MADLLNKVGSIIEPSMLGASQVKARRQVVFLFLIH